MLFPNFDRTSDADLHALSAVATNAPGAAADQLMAIFKVFLVQQIKDELERRARGDRPVTYGGKVIE